MHSTGKVPTLEAIAEQTRSSWAKPIASYAAVPPIYQDFFEPLRVEGRAFPLAVLTPSYEHFFQRKTESLICECDQVIHVLETSGSGFEVKSFPLACISFVQVRTILLDSHIKICGLTRQGIPDCCILRFNSITEYLFRPIVERIRLATFDTRNLDLSHNSEREKFDYLAKVNYKFMSFARHSLLPGDQVIHAVLQPEIRERTFTVLGKTFYRLVSHTHMSILTDREFIMIGEEYTRIGQDRYGGTWDYIPLDKITAVSLNRKSSNLLTLSIQLPENVSLDYLFESSQKRAVEQLLNCAEVRGISGT